MRQAFKEIEALRRDCLVQDLFDFKRLHENLLVADSNSLYS